LLSHAVVHQECAAGQGEQQEESSSTGDDKNSHETETTSSYADSNNAEDSSDEIDEDSAQNNRNSITFGHSQFGLQFVKSVVKAGVCAGDANTAQSVRHMISNTIKENAEINSVTPIAPFNKNSDHILQHPIYNIPTGQQRIAHEILTECVWRIFADTSTKKQWQSQMRI